ncbi:MAG: hypothetical protein HQL53_05065, partial [Magnetococcales bacterium]|nr:hypothetical protein [Magnetococcales bacterium]
MNSLSHDRTLALASIQKPSRRVSIQGHIVWGLLFIFIFGWATYSQAATCLWVSSYHQGYEWNDGIEKGLRTALNGRCKIESFFMDTKRYSNSEYARNKGTEAFALIKSLKPDVIIASDDNASKYLVKPFLRKGKIPVVFCGINWSVTAYGYPYKHATGMVEFAPVQSLLQEIKRTVKRVSKGLYLSSNVPTEHTDFSWYQRMFNTEGVTVESRFVHTIEEWEKGYLTGQQYDFIILGNNAGIEGWGEKRAAHFAMAHAGQLTVTHYDW